MTATHSTLTQSRLKELLQYDQDTGVFIRAKSLTNNSRYTGKEAGTVNRGYIQIAVDGRLYLAHRLVWLYVHGEFPPEEIDHIDHNRSNNRIFNLRLSTRAENVMNQSARKKNNTGVTGIHKIKNRDRWQVNMSVNSIKILSPWFDDFFNAVCHRKSLENKHGFHENHGQ